MTTANSMEILCILDEFRKYFTPELRKHLAGASGKQRRNRPCRLSDSEVMTILVLLHNRHFHHRLHATGVLPHQEDAHAQDNEGMGSKGKVYHFYGFKLHLVTKIKKDMRNSLMNLYDKLMPGKRSAIETVNDELKSVCQIGHARHRSIDNFATDLFAGLIAYNLLPKKPPMNLEIIDKSKLIAECLRRTHVNICIHLSMLLAMNRCLTDLPLANLLQST